MSHFIADQAAKPAENTTVTDNTKAGDQNINQTWASISSGLFTDSVAQKKTESSATSKGGSDIDLNAVLGKMEDIYSSVMKASQSPAETPAHKETSNHKPEHTGTTTEAHDHTTQKPEHTGTTTEAHDHTTHKPEHTGTTTGAHDHTTPKPEHAGTTTEAHDHTTAKTEHPGAAEKTATNPDAPKSVDADTSAKLDRLVAQSSSHVKQEEDMNYELKQIRDHQTTKSKAGDVFSIDKRHEETERNGDKVEWDTRSKDVANLTRKDGTVIFTDGENSRSAKVGDRTYVSVEGGGTHTEIKTMDKEATVLRDNNNLQVLDYETGETYRKVDGGQWQHIPREQVKKEQDEKMENYVLNVIGHLSI